MCSGGLARTERERIKEREKIGSRARRRCCQSGPSQDMERVTGSDMARLGRARTGEGRLAPHLHQVEPKTPDSSYEDSFQGTWGGCRHGHTDIDMELSDALRLQNACAWNACPTAKRGAGNEAA